MLRQHKHLTKKELKKDPLVIFAARAYDFLHEEWIKIVGVIVAVVAVVALSTFFVKESSRSEINDYDAALNALQSNAPEASDLLRKVVDKHGGSESARFALLSLANLAYQDENLESSKEYFEEYLSKYSGDMLSDFGAYLGLGGVYESLGDYSEAAETYTRYIDKYGTSPFNSMMNLYAGKAYMAGNDSAAAHSMFAAIVDNPHDSPQKVEARYYLELLDHQ